MKLPPRTFPFGLLAVLASAGAAAATAPTTTPAWHDVAGSTLGFATTFEGVHFDGRFETFTARVHFDPAQPQQCSIRADIHTASARTGNPDRDRMLPQADFFASAQYPVAIYTASDCQADGAGRWRANGSLQLRGISKPVPLQFTWQREGDTARMAFTATVPRLAFDVGGGQWASASAIGLDVAVSGTLLLAATP